MFLIDIQAHFGVVLGRNSISNQQNFDWELVIGCDVDDIGHSFTYGSHVDSVASMLALPGVVLILHGIFVVVLARDGVLESCFFWKMKLWFSI